MCQRIVSIFHFIAAISELDRLNLKLEEKYINIPSKLGSYNHNEKSREGVLVSSVHSGLDSPRLQSS